jgi:hypothetical protein
MGRARRADPALANTSQPTAGAKDNGGGLCTFPYHSCFIDQEACAVLTLCLQTFINCPQGPG